MSIVIGIRSKIASSAIDFLFTIVFLAIIDCSYSHSLHFTLVLHVCERKNDVNYSQFITAWYKVIIRSYSERRKNFIKTEKSANRVLLLQNLAIYAFMTFKNYFSMCDSPSKKSRLINFSHFPDSNANIFPNPFDSVFFSPSFSTSFDVSPRYYLVRLIVLRL